MIYNTENYVNIHQFHDRIWELVPEELVSNMYIDANENFFRDVLFDLYQYYTSDKLNIKSCSNILISFIRSMFEHKPDKSNIIDNWYSD